MLNGISGSYVDDLLRAGNQEFHDLCKVTHRRFEMSGDDELPLTFSGFNNFKNRRRRISNRPNLLVEEPRTAATRRNLPRFSLDENESCVDG